VQKKARSSGTQIASIPGMRQAGAHGATEIWRDIVVIGASAGGLEAACALLGALPADLGAAILMTLHTAPDSPGNAANVLARAGPLPVVYPDDGAEIRHGCVMLAPPDLHLVVDGSQVRLLRGPRENGVRPAVDPLFRSAARSYGPRVVGVLLSGALDDGTHGLLEIKRGGGLAVVQDPKEAAFPCMALSGLRNVDVDRVLPAKGIAQWIARLAAPHDGESRIVPADARAAAQELQGIPPAPPAAITCPECGGALRDASEGDLVRFQCHVGHAYNGENLLVEHGESVERALWTALRILEEASALRLDMASRAFVRGLHGLEQGYRRQATEFERRASLIRAVLERETPTASPLERRISLADAP
jgi:two-component system chemotaxis response regulator CheB